MKGRLIDKLEALSGSESVPLHMPGHKRNTEGLDFLEKLGARYDITEIEGFDDLHHPRGILKQAMERAARLWKSKRSYFLVNGSTGGILAAVRAASLNGSGRLIMARNCHISVYNAALINGLEAVYLSPDPLESLGLCGSVPPFAVESALKEYPGAPVIITSPSYEGVISDLASIAAICHAHGSPLLVDEAHGAHLDLSPHFTGGAVSAGADIAVQSVHKTLTGLTQSAILHLNGGLISPEAVQTALSIYQTSSPSYPIMASIDASAELINDRGPELFVSWNARLEDFYKRTAKLQNIRLAFPDGEAGVFGFDRSKLIIYCRGLNITGPELSEKLRAEYGIYCEMAAGSYCLAMTGLTDREESLVRLASALLVLDAKLEKTGEGRPLSLPAIPPQAMSAAEALSRPARAIPVREALGKVCAEYVYAYPPGIPLIAPGEEITSEFIEALTAYQSAGVSLTGSSGLPPGTIRIAGA
jgi:arginine/lysine/ornithine decarboxylase